MFCQYIQLWMYVVPAADLWRQCRPLFSALDIKAQLTVCSLSPLFPPASHSSPLIFLSPCSLSAPRPLLPPFSLLPSSSAHSVCCRAAKTGPTSVAMLPATVLAVLLPSTPLVAPGILRSHPCLCRRWMVSPSGRVWSPPPPGRPPAGAPPEQQEGEGGAGGAGGAGAAAAGAAGRSGPVPTGALVVGISGASRAGKSMLAGQLARHYTNLGCDTGGCCHLGRGALGSRMTARPVIVQVGCGAGAAGSIHGLAGHPGKPSTEDRGGSYPRFTIFLR